MQVIGEPPVLPTSQTVWAIAALAPIALLVGTFAPALWLVTPVIGLGIIVLAVVDAALAPRCDKFWLDFPEDTEIGETAALTVRARFKGSGAIEPRASLQFDPRLGEGGRADFILGRDSQSGLFEGTANVVPVRRGTAQVSRSWLRWRGPLGLGARQKSQSFDDIAVRIAPNLSPVRSDQLQNFLRDAQSGLIARRIRGEGTQFEALTEYEAGMDRRRIDWKASARHTHLYARENESERNNPIVFAFDCGQAMCEPVDGLPRIDRAVSAALTCAYVALKGGDHAALFGFARHPQLMTPFVRDLRSFHRLQSAAAALDYEASEPNFTLALAALSARLKRRSLIVLFSDFTDATAAQLMVESVGRLTTKHLVIFVTFADSELEQFIEAEPGDIATLAKSVTADTLLQQRLVVLQQLRQMGVDVIEAPYQEIGFALIDRYLELRSSEAIG